jgi:hypothetical protein
MSISWIATDKEGNVIARTRTCAECEQAVAAYAQGRPTRVGNLRTFDDQPPDDDADNYDDLGQDDLLARVGQLGFNVDVMQDASPAVLAEVVRVVSALRDVADDAGRKLQASGKAAQPGMYKERARPVTFAERTYDLNRVKSFAARHKETLAAAGQTPEQFVQKFAEMQRKHPTYRAGQFLDGHDEVPVLPATPAARPKPKVRTFSERTADVNRITRWAQQHQRELAAAGKTPAQFVQDFQKQQAAFPDLSAADILGGNS